MGLAVIRRMDDYEARPVRWVWPQRVPMGKLTLLAGDPGLGKSYLTLDLAARVSTGVLPPTGSEGGDGRSGDVIVLSAEDDPSDTIRPRLDRMGADLRRVHFIESMYFDKLQKKRYHPIDLDRDMHAIAEAVRTTTCPRLIIIDPISAYLGEKDGHSNAEVRALLADLARLAEWSGAAIVCVTHLNKGGAGQKAVYRSMGSLAFTAAARVVLIVARHPQDTDSRILATVKNNLCVEAPPLAYRIEGERVRWLDERIDFSCDDLESPERAEQAGGVGEACDWLADVLRDGPVAAERIRADAERDGLSFSTVKRAKRRLGVESRRENVEGGASGDGAWAWVLPA